MLSAQSGAVQSSRAFVFLLDGACQNTPRDLNSQIQRKNVNTLNALIASGETCYILTKAANEDARDGKIDWLAKYVPAMDAEHFICIVGYGRKIDYIREDGILIDDDEKNTKQWIKGGQIAIHLEVRGEAVTL